MDRDQIEPNQYDPEKGQPDTSGYSLEAARCADAEDRAHQQPEVEPPGMDQQPLEDVLVTAQVRTAHAARVIEMGERAFDPFAPLAHQAPSAPSANPSAIAIHGHL